MRDAASSQAVAAQQGLIARWAQKFSARGDAPEGESDPDFAPRSDDRNGHAQPAKGAFSREIDRRRQLYSDIGAFLFAHDLDLTPLNFGLAHDYLTGADHGIEKAVQAILRERGKITNGWAETVIAEKRDDVTPEALAEMLDRVEENLSHITGLVDESRSSAKDYGAALQEQVKDLSDAARTEPVLRLRTH